MLHLLESIFEWCPPAPKLDDLPSLYCTSSLVLMMCLIRTATSSLALKIFLIRTAHPCLYGPSSLVVRILTCTAHPHLYCASSLVLRILTCTAHPHLYCTSSIVLYIVYTGCKHETSVRMTVLPFPGRAF